MPPQSVEVAETIAAIKRALKREKEAPSEQQIASATNRGNKLKRGANVVHAGALPYRHTQNGHRLRIEHAGYQRYILSRNPKRYNEYGDELADSESDQEADADAEDENPYGDIRLEELLRPLTHAAELEHHPTMSQAYLDPAIPDMVLSTEAKVRQERANLWRAKNLFRHFVGDESWMPCASVEQEEDWDLFGPLPQAQSDSSSGRKERRDHEEELLRNGVEERDLAEDEINNAEKHTIDDPSKPTRTDPSEAQSEQKQHAAEQEEPTESTTKETETEADEDTVTDTIMDGIDDTQENGISHTNPPADISSSDTVVKPPAEHVQDEDNAAPDTSKATNDDGGTDADAEETPPPPPRRITRALAANNPSNTATPPLSPTSSALSTIDSALLEPHPIFLLPPKLQIAHSTHHSNLPLHVAHSGLPIDEIIETRRLLGMYIQKQEETIRGLEAVLGKLIKAKRLRDQVWEWCKAEGHVGDWSDGEDWVDTEAWGIPPNELKKGKDEDNNEEEDVVGRKGKRRRARDKD